MISDETQHELVEAGRKFTQACNLLAFARERIELYGLTDVYPKAVSNAQKNAEDAHVRLIAAIEASKKEAGL